MARDAAPLRTSYALRAKERQVRGRWRDDTARLHPVKLKKGGEIYYVIFRGELLVERSGDPECDAARALLAKGITGKLTHARWQEWQAAHRDRH
jgi:hypothetical protein